MIYRVDLRRLQLLFRPVAPSIFAKDLYGVIRCLVKRKYWLICYQVSQMRRLRFGGWRSYLEVGPHSRPDSTTDPENRLRQLCDRRHP